MAQSVKFFLKMILTDFGESVTQFVYMYSNIVRNISGAISDKTNGISLSPAVGFSANIALKTAHRADKIHL